jgi:hypothetical protein
MKSKVQLKLKRLFQIISVCILTCGYSRTIEGQLNFDEILDKTPYASLLKELICLTDTIGLLRHRIKADERRFIEDSVLGKMVRVKQLIKQIDFTDVVQDDIDYLYYWLAVATTETLPELLMQQIDELKCSLSLYVQNSLQSNVVS